MDLKISIFKIYFFKFLFGERKRSRGLGEKWFGRKEGEDHVTNENRGWTGIDTKMIERERGRPV